MFLYKEALPQSGKNLVIMSTLDEASETRRYSGFLIEGASEARPHDKES